MKAKEGGKKWNVYEHGAGRNIDVEGKKCVTCTSTQS